MRGKRSKQYRKLMSQYGLTFGFREPYQVLLDDRILEDAARFKMDLIAGLERTLHGKVKPMISQCSMRHLYQSENKNEALIEQAKTYERRRCNHMPPDFEQPLSTLECLTSVVDSKGNNTNKHRYVVASQDTCVRAHMRRIPGVPLVYINRSVMIMEPMGGATENVREQEERQKFKAGLKSRHSSSTLGKRQRDDSGSEKDDDDTRQEPTPDIDTPASNTQATSTKKRRKGPKGANPLSVKKPKSRTDSAVTFPDRTAQPPVHLTTATTEETATKKKRKRKAKPKAEVVTSGSPAD